MVDNEMKTVSDRPYTYEIERVSACIKKFACTHHEK